MLQQLTGLANIWLATDGDWGRIAAELGRSFGPCCRFCQRTVGGCFWAWALTIPIKIIPLSEKITRGLMGWYQLIWVDAQSARHGWEPQNMVGTGLSSIIFLLDRYRQVFFHPNEHVTWFLLVHQGRSTAEPIQNQECPQQRQRGIFQAAWGHQACWQQPVVFTVQGGAMLMLMNPKRKCEIKILWSWTQILLRWTTIWGNHTSLAWRLERRSKKSVS